MKLSIVLIVVITLSTAYGATIKKEEFIELCHAAGQLVLNGLSPASINQVIKQKSQLSILQRPEEKLGSTDELYNELGSKIVESIINLFVDGIVRMFKDSYVTLSMVQSVLHMKNSSLSAFCNKLPLPDSIDTENPVTTLTALVNYVNNLPPLISSVANRLNNPEISGYQGAAKASKY
ncbi:uncharacterized protein LOC128389161 [Panonychus citri]|uniref:uncharacterized protein LOC128389161 n=1 Tax=Panonychus citri TaxID=50023 RepID=UPI0023078362|nr:uncharacterized protein LOC128389161 [Panonychus citri]